ncbi:MAG: NADH-ubiquinone oxidoreductase [Alphaproteobacteria bacterium]|nr:NADH-ubiquinone oxidoreductase [Alphaproteobacteria bacterium]
MIRDPEAWRPLGLPGERRVVDLADTRTLGDTLADARQIVSCAPASFLPGILAVTSPEVRLIALAGPIRYSRTPDGEGLGVRAGEAAFISSGRCGVMVHPTFIYGRHSVAGLLARLRSGKIIALPGGGRRIIQPVFERDVIEALLVAIDREWPGPRNLVAAGPRPLRFDAFLAALAGAAGVAMPRLMSVPGMFAGMLGAGDFHLPDEDQAFPPEPLAELLGRPPLGLEAGLAHCVS